MDKDTVYKCPYCDTELKDFDECWVEKEHKYEVEIARCPNCNRDVPIDDAVKQYKK